MIRGEVHLIFRDVNTGEITKELTKTNVITESMLTWMANPAYISNGTLADSDGQGKFGEFIFLSDMEHRSDRDWSLIYNPIAIGRTESGIQNPNLLSGNVGSGASHAHYIQYQQRFDPPGSTRNIYVIAIGRWDATSIPSNKYPISVCAYLPLTIPCVQSPTETLDIFYRIIFNNPDRDTDNTTLSNNQIFRIARRHIYSASGYTNDFEYYPLRNRFYYNGSKMVSNIRNQYLFHGGRGREDDSNKLQNYSDNGYRAHIMRFTGNLSEYLGRCIGSVGSSSSIYNGELFFNPVLKPSDTPIQNIFSQSNVATKPFYDSTTIALGDGTLSIDGSSWTNPDWNKLLRLEITGNGNASTATYRLWMRPVIGFIDNTYEEDHVAIPVLHGNNNDYGMFLSYSSQDQFGNNSGSNHYGAYATPYDDSTFLAYVHNRLARVNVSTLKREYWASGTTPSADFQDISQVHVTDNGDMWIADALTGLYRITADGLTVSNFDNTHTDLTGITSSACYGVARTPGRIWCIMHNSLIYTTDNGVSFTVYDSGTTPAFNYAPSGQEYRYWFLQGDPNHADHRLAIAYNEYSSYTSRADLIFHWWDSVTGAVSVTPRLSVFSTNTNGNPQRRRELFNFFHCSPNDGVWGSRILYDASNGNIRDAGLWDFGQTQETHSFTTSGYENNENAYAFWWSKDTSGNDAMIISRTENTSYRFAILKQDGNMNLSQPFSTSQTAPDGAPVNHISSMFQYGPKCVLPSGVFIASNEYYNQSYPCWYMLCASDNNTPNSGAFHNTIWKEYGWNGSAWEEGNPNSKTMQNGAVEPLVEGLTVSWNDAGATQTYVAGDYYTTGVIDGILVDGGIEFDHRYALYYKKVVFDQTDIEGGGILPATTSVANINLNELEQQIIIDGSNAKYDDPYNRWNGISSGIWAGRMGQALTGEVNVRVRAQDVANGGHITFGVADVAKIGSTPTPTNIDYAVKISSVGNENWKVEIIQNGTLVNTVYDPGGSLPSYSGDFNNNNDSSIYYQFLREYGSNDLNLYIRNQLVWTWTGVTTDLILSAYSTYYNTGLYWNLMSSSYTDYHIDIGNSVNGTGVFDPNFFAIDYTAPGRPLQEQIKIDGVPVTTLLVNDLGRTTLAAGEVELLTYQGKVRYSAADIGKTLTIDRYNVLLNES